MSLIEWYADSNKSAFAKAIGVGSGVIGDIIGGRLNKPSFDVLTKIVYAYPDVRLDWLVKGEEPRLYSDIVNTRPETTNGLQILPITVDDHGEENIVMVDTKAQGGYPAHYLEPEFYKHLPTIKLPLARFRNGTFRAFEVNGDSMSPTLHHGAIVFGRYEDNWEKGNIQEGYIYIVVTQEAVVVKRVLNRLDRGELYLMSDNEGYEGYPVRSQEVLQLWRVVGGLINKFPNTRYDWRRKMSHMEADIYELRQELSQLKRLLP